MDSGAPIQESALDQQLDHLAGIYLNGECKFAGLFALSVTTLAKDIAISHKGQIGLNSRSPSHAPGR
jgi:hypothetical protein